MRKPSQCLVGVLYAERTAFRGTPDRISAAPFIPRNGSPLSCFCVFCQKPSMRLTEALALGVKGYVKELSVQVVRVAGKGCVTIT